jgi:glycosyltransferase involved in cell wall biosynthesis
VAQLTAELDAVLNQLDEVSDILFIDDASTDGTLDVLNRLRQQYPRLRVISHAARCGQSAGQATGFRYAWGELIVTMDADGQNDPRDIPYLLEALQHADAVTGIRRQRCDRWLKRVASRLANAFRNAVTRDYITDAGCAYRALRREVLYEVPVFNGLHRFLPTLLRMQGFRVVEREVNHRPRSGGVSKYGIHDRLWRGLLDCLAMCWLRWRVIPGNRVSSIDLPQMTQPALTEFVHEGGR